MLTEVVDALSLEGVSSIPPTDRILRSLNRAKNDSVARIETVDPCAFSTRQTYDDIAAGSTYIGIPDGVNVPTGVSGATVPPACRRIIGLYLVDQGVESDIPVFDRRITGSTYSAVGFWMYREGQRLYFDQFYTVSGNEEVLMRYAQVVPDLDNSDADARYSLLPSEWTDLVVLQAICDLLPGANPGRAKWLARRAERYDLMQTAKWGVDSSTPPMIIPLSEEDSGPTVS